MSANSNTKTYLTLLELLRSRAEGQSEQIAYTFLKDGETDAVSLTYQELDLKARAIAAQLQQLKLNGSRALMVYPYDGSLEFIAAFFGCLYAGVVAVPCHPPRNQYGFVDLQGRLDSSQAEIVLTKHNLLKKLKSQLANPQLHWLTTEQIPTSLASDWLEPQIDQDTLAFLQYTSGSTGLPKGVAIAHECIRQNQEMLKLAFGHDRQPIGVSWLPLFHDMGLIGNVIQSLYLGRPCIFISPIAFIQKPIRWLQAISRYQATTSGAPNFAYELLYRHVSDEQKSSLDLQSWDVAFSGAEPIQAETIERFAAKFASCGFRREAFYPCYGMAEATLFICGGKKQDPPVVKYVEQTALEQNRVIVSPRPREGFRALVGCGQAWLDRKIVIVDPKSLIPCSANQVGEIWVSGSGIAKGYWDRPQETDSVFQANLKDSQANCFLRTGDLGFILDGELFITGRLHDVMVFWGLNHYPQHLEQTVEKCHPGLRPNSSAAFAVKVGGEDKLVIAVEIERSYRQCLVISEVVEAIRWAVFDAHFVDVYALALLQPGSIPKTSSGKIQRRRCRNKFLAESLDLVGEWRSPEGENSDLKTLIARYLNPLTHLSRYSTFARGRLRRFWYLLRN